LILTIFLVFVAELANTSVEIAVDLVTRKMRPRAMMAKDVAAGAVLAASINALVIAYFLFFKRLFP
jgi:diacylglycerol kinase (ATP)